MASHQRPYEFGRLITSTIAGRESDAHYENGLSQAIAKRFGSPAWAGIGYCLPPRSAARDLLTTPASAAGDLIGESIAAVAQSVRPVTVLEAAGMQVIETSGDFFHLPRWTAASAGWVAENGSIPSLGTTVSTVDLAPKIAGARLAFSRRLSLLVDGIEQQVLAEVSRAVRSLIESAVIAGSGVSSEPLGLLNLPGKKSKTFAGSTPTLAELSDMVELVTDADADISRLAFVLHPSDLRDLLIAEKVASTGELIVQWHEGRYRIFGIPVFTTTNCTEGKVLLGDFSAGNLAFFGPPQAIVDRFSGGKATTGQTEIVVLNMVDVGCTNQNAICVGSA